MAIVTTDEKHYQDIANAIREHTNPDVEFKPSEMAGAVGKVFDAGKQAERHDFFTAYQENIKKTASAYAFTYYGWNDKIYNPVGTIHCGWSANQMYERSNITDTKVPLDMTTLTNNASNMFKDSKIHTTHLIVAETTPLAATFTNATRLANVTFEGVIGKNCNMQWCPLTADSIRGVVEHLSTTETDRTVTFNKAAKEAAFTQTEWDELIATRPNWTFSLI